jgi:colanic acid/amylovoran biosynthesis glycosyltransferase
MEQNISEMARVLIVGINWPPETFLERLIKSIADAGVEIIIACNERPSAEWFSNPMFRWVRTPSWDITFTKRLLSLIAMLVRKLVQGPRSVWKIMHLGSGSFRDRLRVWYRLLPFVGQSWDVTYFPWNFAAIEYSELFDLGPPAVISCRGSQVNVAPHDPRRAAMIERLRITFRKAAAVHCVSESIKAEATHYGLDPGKAKVIHPAVDPDFFRPGNRSNSADPIFNIVTTGSLSWVKGHEYALLAIRDLLDQGIRACFHIIGTGSESSRLLFTIRDLHLDGKVHLHGRLTQFKVRSRLQQAHAFLLSSLSEGISNAVLEAMACGLPVVTTDCGGMAEAVTDGVEGLVVPVRDPEAMAAALARLASDSELSSRLGQAARQRVLKDFTLQRQIGKFLELYRGVIKNSGPE